MPTVELACVTLLPVTKDPEDIVIDCEPLLDAVGSVGLALNVEFEVGKGAEVPPIEGDEIPDEAAGDVLAVSDVPEETVSDPERTTLCVGSEPEVGRPVDPGDSAPDESPFDGCVRVLGTLPVIAAVLEAPNVVPFSIIVIVTEMPEDRMTVVTASSVLVPGMVIWPPVFSPLLAVEGPLWPVDGGLP